MRKDFLMLFFCLLICNIAVVADEECKLVIIKPSNNEAIIGKNKIQIQSSPIECQWDKIEIYVDGKLVSALYGTPCEVWWDFGNESKSHQIRVLGYNKNNEVITSSISTKALHLDYSEDVKLIEVYAAAINRKGKYIYGLEQNDFEIFVDSKPIEITHFAKEDSKLSLVLLMDVSKTMANFIEGAKLAAINFVNNYIKIDDQIMLIVFNHKINHILSFTNDKTNIIKELSQLKSGGGTSLYDAVMDSLNTFKGIRGRKAIIIYSDGKDETSIASLQTTIEAVKSSEPTIFVIGFGEALKDKKLKSFLSLIAKASGGASYFSEDLDELYKIYEEIGNKLRAQYLLAFPPRVSKKDGSWHHIVVKLKNKKGKVIAREGFYDK